MRSTRLARIAAGVVAVVLLTAACAVQAGAAVPPAGPGPGPGPRMTPVPVVAGPAQDLTLTDAQIATALLGPQDVPASWQQADGPTTDTGAVPGRVDPPTCQAPAAPTDPTVEAVAARTTHFSVSDAVYFQETVASYTADPTRIVLDPLVDYVTRCPTITATASGGATSTVTFTTVAAPAVDAPSTAYTMDAGRSFAVTIVVVVGHTAITVVAGGPTAVDPDLVGQLVTTALTKVRAAAAAG